MRVTDALAPDDQRVDANTLLSGQSVGVLPRREWRALVGVLRDHTVSDRLFVGLWEGFVAAGAGAVELPRPLELANRRYQLAQIPLADAEDSAILHAGYSPSLVWPEDHAWFVNTDIDALSTYVGGSVGAIEDVLAHPDLESAPAEPDDPL